ncbi:MAG: CHRD domain-containing protein [Bacteroidia bacterium]
MKLHILPKGVFLFFGILGLAISGANAQTYTGKLTGTQEVPPVLTVAEGNITATLIADTLEISGVFSNLSSDVDTNIAGGSHIHIGYAGQNGGIRFSLDADLDPNMRGGVFNAANNRFTLTTQDREMLENHQMYVNIHTEDHGSGEIRAQLLPEASMYYMSNIFGSNEVPPVLTDGHGGVIVEVDSNQIRLSGSFSGLSAAYTASHIHIGLAGSNGPVEFALNPTLDGNNRGGVYEADSNTFTIQPSQLQDFAERNLYVNIHTTAYPGGEIRGQLISRALAVFRVHLSGATEVPSAPSAGHGGIIAELDSQQLIISGSFAELGADYSASHIHAGMAGEAGPVVIPLTAFTGVFGTSGDYLPSSNTYPVSSGLVDTLFMRGLYHNVHTSQYPGGELRGQLLPESHTYFNSIISGMNEVPMVITRGQGGVSLELHDTTLIVSGSFRDLGSAYTASHIHTGLSGANGPVAFALNASLAGNGRSGYYHPDNNRFELSAAQAQNLRERRLYVNIHSQMYPTGEMRGQVLPAATFYFHIGLAPFNESHLVRSRAKGMMMGEINGNRLTLSGSFANLSSDFASGVAGGSHIHGAIAGRAGGIKTSLTVDLSGNNRDGEYEAASNSFTISQGYKDSIFNRLTYVNIHSLNYTGGEIRGQLLPIANMYFHALLGGGSAVPPVNTEAGGRVIAELRNNRLTVTGSFNGLMSDFDTAASSGIYTDALAGNIGNLFEELNAASTTDMRGGAYLADSNHFTLSSGMIDTLMMRMTYINVPSTDNANGEIRGQLLPNADHYFMASLDGFNEVPSVNSNGFGAAVLELRGPRLVLSGSFSGLASDFNANIGGGSHLHGAGPGANGSVAIGLNVDLDTNANNRAGFWNADSNMFVLSGGMLDTLVQEDLYLNVHSVQQPSGELRGQVLQAPNHFPDSAMILNPAPGSSETISGAPGQILQVNWNDVRDADENEVVYVWELAADASYNTILLRIPTGTDTVINFTYAEIDTLLDQTGVSPGGSFTYHHRVYASDGSLYTIGESASVTLTRGAVGDYSTNLVGVHEVQPVFTTGRGIVTVTRVGADSIAVNGIFSNLQSAVDTSIQGGAHIHLGETGTNGSIVFPLNFRIDANQEGGQFEGNRFRLTPQQSADLDNGDFYVNVHTNTFAGGEIRGQLLPIDNTAPSAPALTSPPDNDVIVIEAGLTSFDVTWSSVSDPDGDKVVYIWQASATADFTKLIFNRNTGTTPEFSASHATMDSILTEAGVAIGQQITVYHRVLASDGSLYSASPTRIVTLQNQRVGIEEDGQPQVDVSVYPNPVSGSTMFRFSLEKPSSVTVKVYNVAGKEVSTLNAGNLPSGDNSILYNTDKLAAGIYSYRMLVSDGTLVREANGKLKILD